MALIYFAQPIDFSTERDRQTASNLIDELRTEGLTVFKPAQAWQVQQPFDSRTQRINELVLRQSDCMVAILPSGSASRGVPAEIALANEIGVPVVMLHDQSNNKSLIEQHWASHPNVYAFDMGDVPAAAWRAQYLAVEERDASNTGYFIGNSLQMTKVHEGDAGFDLAYNGHTVLEIAPGSMAKIPTGVHIQLPKGMYAIITGRSSTFAKRNLITPLSVIDNGFRGELFAVVWNFGTETATIAPNERVVQLLPMNNVADVLKWQHVALLDGSARATNGFGSSGR
jgi:dUTP pyrophosphatase